MELKVTTKAFEWFEKELNLKKKDYVRFYVRYGGPETDLPGFSLGISKDTPSCLGISFEKNEVTFFFEEEETWYLENKNLTVDFNNEKKEIIYNVH